MQAFNDRTISIITQVSNCKTFKCISHCFNEIHFKAKNLVFHFCIPTSVVCWPVIKPWVYNARGQQWVRALGVYLSYSLRLVWTTGSRAVGHKTRKFLEINFPISIKISFSDHWFNLSLGQRLAEVVHGQPQLLLWYEAVSISVKHLKRMHHIIFNPKWENQNLKPVLKFTLKLEKW